MISETSELLNIIKEKTTETPSKTLEIITSGKVDVNLRSSKSETYLHFIAHAYSGDADEAILVPVVFQLSNSGIDMASADADGNTALHVAAKQAGARKLLRALIMIGVDPLQQNQSGHTALQLAKSFPDNAAILTQFSPGLWNAILKNNTGQLNRLMDSWCKINTSKYGQTLIKMAQTSAYTEILDQVNEREKTVEFVHYALAGDRAKLRPFFKMSSVNVNTQTTGYIDGGSGDFITLPLVGEAAMLGLASIVRKLVRKGAHIDVTVRNVPLFLYVMQNTKNNNPFYETLDVILDKTDFKKKNIRKHTYAVLDAAYDRKLPIPTLQIMSANGLDLFALDDDGHFLRDRIMIRYATGSPARLTSELTYLDRILVDMAKNGCLDLLQSLLERGYEHIDVSDPEFGSVANALEAKVGTKKACLFMEDVRTLPLLYREISHAIYADNLVHVQTLSTTGVLRMRDKYERTLLYRATLFERRHVLRLLMKLAPESAKIPDREGRTPLFVACALEEGEDIQRELVALGCTMEDIDKNGQSPDDIKRLSAKEKQAFLARERERDFGLDTHLLAKYLDIKEAIRLGDLSLVEQIRSQIYKDVQTKDIAHRMYQTTPPCKCLLEFSMQARRDAIAKYLLTLGMDWTVKYKDGGEEVTLMELARRKQMKGVIAYIEYQEKKQREHQELIKMLRRKGVVKSTKKTED